MGRAIRRTTWIGLTLGLLVPLIAAAEPTEFSFKDYEVPPLAFNGPWDSTVTFSISNQIRGEFINWWKPPPTSSARDNRDNFLGNRFKFGVGVAKGPVQVFAQFQHTLLDGLPSGGPGPGGLYFANTSDTFQQASILRNGWAHIRGWDTLDGFSIMGGRIPYSDGMQAIAEVDNPALRFLLGNRIQERLIGNFEYTMVGRSFDGGKIQYENENINVTVAGFMPTYGGFEIDANEEITDIHVIGASLNLPDSDWLPRSVGRLFYHHYNDSRDIVVLDNRPLPVREASVGKSLDINTIGGNFVHVEEFGPGRGDALFWGVYQFGDWQQLDHSAWAWTAEFGYQFPEFYGKPWLRAGITRGSGDSDPNDGDHDSFFQMLPTCRLYARTPFYNMMNNQDVFLQGYLFPHPTLSIMVAGHWLRANESADLAYFGSGATSDTFFGFGGMPTHGYNEGAYLLDVALTWKPNRNVKFYGYYGHGFGQGIVNANFTTRNLDYSYIEMVVSF